MSDSQQQDKPNHLDQARAILTPDLGMVIKQVTDGFYQELDTEFSDFKGHTLISQFSFDEAWPTWEVHPKGDEFVMLLGGDTDMIVAQADGSQSVTRVSTPGEYVIVPRGLWHTARPHAPTTMLFVTPGEGTLNEVR